jgi:hypothetical protein
MAAEDRSRSDYTAILIPYRLTAADLTPSSSYEQDDPMPGDLTSSASPLPRLQLNAFGDQSSTSYNVQIQQGGNIKPGGAAFIWKETTDGSTSYRGWDAPNNLAWHTFIDRKTVVTASVDTPDAASLPEGGVIVVGSSRTALNAHVRAYILGTDGTISEVNVTGNLAVPSSRLYQSYHPTVAIMQDQSIVVACMVEDTTTETAQVNVYRSTDTGATFDLVSQYALPASLDTNTTDGRTIRRLRLRNAGGRCLLLMWVGDASGAVDGYLQYASDSDGLSYDLVEENDGTAYPIGYPDVTTLDDQFYVSLVGGSAGGPDRLSFVSLASPYETISGKTQTTLAITDIAVITSNVFTDGENAITADTDGSIYVTVRYRGSGNYRIFRSNDLATTWEGMGGDLTFASLASANNWSPASTLYPESVNLVASGGRLFVYGNHVAPTTTALQGSLSEWALGGWSTVTMPGNVLFGRITGRASWALAYFPGEYPDNLSEWTKTSTGTPTEDLRADGLYNEASGTETLFYTATHTSTPSEGLIVEWVQQQEAGGSTTAFLSGASGRVEDASAGYEWQARVSTTGAVLHDPTAGANVSGFSTLSLSANDVIEYRIEVRGSSVQGWYRVYSDYGDRVWTSWGTGTLTSTGGSGTPTNRVTFGGKHSSSSPVTAPEANFSAVRATYEEFAGVRTLPFTNPDDLFPRDVSPIGRTVTIDENYRINGTGGPGRRGDAYTGSPRYGYPIDLVHWPDSLSPREAWRSTAGTTQAAQQLFRYEISDQSENTRLTAAIGLFLGGVRAWRTGKIKLNDSGGTPTTFDFDLTHTGAGFTFTRYGNTVIPSSAGTSGVVLQRNEAAGWWLLLDDGAGNTKWIEVLRNTEGVLAGAAGMPTRLFLQGVPAASPTSGTAYLVPSSAVVVVHLQDQDVFNVQIEIDAQETEDQRIHLGCMWLGEVYAFPDGPESGARFTTTAATRTTETEARIASAQNVGPPRREFELAWSGVAYTGAAEGTAADPNYSKASDHASALPMGLPDVIPYTVEGLYRLCNGPERPVVILRNLPKQGSGSQVRVITARDDVIPAQITGTATIRDVAGVPGTDSAKSRGEALAFTELV